MKIIEERRDGLERLCRKYHTSKLELFGSTVTDRFDGETSDLDFIVSFDDLAPGAYAETYFGLLEGLRELFQRPIDLVTEPSIKNPYFLEEIQKTRTVI